MQAIHNYRSGLRKNVDRGDQEHLRDPRPGREASRRHRCKQKRIRTAELGVLEVYCQMLYDLDQDQALLIFTATPGSDSHDKLELLSVIGAQKLRSPS